jgi:hypothetical protein
MTESKASSTGVTVTPRWVLHVDLDQFIAAVEIRRDPALRGRPVVVGGDGDPTRRRQVVATASYEARAFGVHSGMPLTTAHRKCPDAVFLPSDRDAYDAASEEVWNAVRELPVVTEVWGWDEAFVGTDADDPEPMAHEVRGTVQRRTGFTCCVGIGDNKVRAKMATGFAKAPDGSLPEDAPGVFRLTRQNWLDVMGDRATDALWGVGAKTSAKLTELGITTVRELASASSSPTLSAACPSTRFDGPPSRPVRPARRTRREEARQDRGDLFALVPKSESSKPEHFLALVHDHLVHAHHVVPPQQRLHVLHPVDLGNEVVLVELGIEVAASASCVLPTTLSRRHR